MPLAHSPFVAQAVGICHASPRKSSQVRSIFYIVRSNACSLAGIWQKDRTKSFRVQYIVECFCFITSVYFWPTKNNQYWPNFRNFSWNLIGCCVLLQFIDLFCCFYYLSIQAHTFVNIINWYEYMELILVFSLLDLKLIGRSGMLIIENTL